MNWKHLESDEQLAELVKQSHDKPQVIFKHSTRCSVSSMVKSRLDASKAPHTIDFHYLDLIRYRSLSNQIASDFKVSHESPQILLIKKGKCVYDESHTGIRMADIESELA